ncbi:MAG TPA: hypothetical protein DDW52_23385 [Planctomycetaceae bacterium]|nr:hypothetical protein [Planctomycetaceae bacterium]
MIGPKILKFPSKTPGDDPIVITGIGLACSLGSNREDVWKAIQRGQSGVRLTTEDDPVGPLRLPAAMIDWLDAPQLRLAGEEEQPRHALKSLRITECLVEEALEDADLPWDALDRGRFGCSISAQFGHVNLKSQTPADGQAYPEWQEEFLPCTASGVVGSRYGLHGPRLCHTTACASGLVSTIAGARALQDGQADFMLCGAADAVTELVFSSFYRMGVFSKGPDVATACKPFDRKRNGFVMGEGGSMMVLERRSHAIERGATIYAELSSSSTMCQAHHVTGLDQQSDTLSRLIGELLRKSEWQSHDVDYISAHGTGTEQNDVTELSGIRAALGEAADELLISSNKAVAGHLINAAGSLELAIAALAMRDSYAPPTMHLTDPEPVGEIDCLAQTGHVGSIDRILKLSLAFGGHLVGMGLKRFDHAAANMRQALPLVSDALVRNHWAASRTAA